VLLTDNHQATLRSELCLFPAYLLASADSLNAMRERPRWHWF